MSMPTVDARVLVVDDEPVNARILERALSGDYLVMTASSGEEALRVASSNPRPDMILLDVLMPDTDGFEICRRLMAEPRTARIPVIFITALDDQINEEQGLQLGAVDYIHKPVNPAVVRARVSMHLELARHRAVLGRLLARRTEDLASVEEDARAAWLSLQRSEETFRGLVEGSIQGIIIHRSWTPLFVNSAYAGILGYDSPEQVFALGSLRALLPPDDGPPDGEAPRRQEHAVAREDGTHVVLETITSATSWRGEPATLVTAVDVTDRKRAERALRRSRARFRDFAEASSDWFWETDAELNFTHVTDKAATGISVEGLDALRLTRKGGGIPKDVARDPRKWERLWGDLEARRPFRGFEFPLRNVEGEMRHLRASGKPIFERGRFVGYRGVAADATDIVRSQRQANLLRDAVDVSRDAVALYDRDLRMVFTNDQFHSLFPSAPSKSDIVGMDRAEVMAATLEAGALPAPEGDASKDDDFHELLEMEAGDESLVSEVTYPGGRAYLRRHRRLADGGLMLLWTDITAQKAAERELQRLAAEVALTSERDRRAIASELHDGPVQNLGLVRILFDTMRKRFGDDVDVERVDEIRTLLETAIREMRTLMSELSPPMLYELGLDPALQWLVDQYAGRHGLDCAVRLEGERRELPSEVAISMFQAARELLLNVVKHAGASSVVVTRRIADGQIAVTVADDGRGIAGERLRQLPSDTGGFGLFSLRERMRILGGNMRVESDDGCRITITVPLEEAG